MKILFFCLSLFLIVGCHSSQLSSEERDKTHHVATLASVLLKNKSTDSTSVHFQLYTTAKENVNEIHTITLAAGEKGEIKIPSDRVGLFYNVSENSSPAEKVLIRAGWEYRIELTNDQNFIQPTDIKKE